MRKKKNWKKNFYKMKPDFTVKWLYSHQSLEGEGSVSLF